MNYILKFIDIFIHLDKYLNEVIKSYGTLTYLLLFLVIFCETGLVVIPFLPGDSLVFTAGMLAASSGNKVLNVGLLFVILCAAAILGDTANYHIGKNLGPKIFQQEKIKFLNKENLEKTQHFYEKHGGKTIIIARFMPIIRTFAPFVAGIGEMSYLRFLSFNAVGGVAWISVFLFGGYFFGGFPFVKNNLTIVIFGIIFVSLIPAVIGYLKSKKQKKQNEVDNK